MMNKISKKLRSEKGASITFALLIFLVCAVVSSAVLVAATAASGRVSQEAEMDQRYYSVTSAAEILKELIDGTSVTYAKVLNGIVENDDDAIAGADELIASEQIINNGTEKEITDNNTLSLTFLENATYLYCTKGDSNLGNGSLSLSLTTSTGDSDLDLKVRNALGNSFKATIKDNELVIDVYNAADSEKYTVEMTFDADVRTTIGRNTSTNTTTVTKIVTWNLTDVQNLQAEADNP